MIHLNIKAENCVIKLSIFFLFFTVWYQTINAISSEHPHRMFWYQFRQISDILFSISNVYSFTSYWSRLSYSTSNKQHTGCWSHFLVFIRIIIKWHSHTKIISCTFELLANNSTPGSQLHHAIGRNIKYCPLFNKFLLKRFLTEEKMIHSRRNTTVLLSTIFFK